MVNSGIKKIDIPVKPGFSFKAPQSTPLNDQTKSVVHKPERKNLIPFCLQDIEDS